MYKLRNNGFTLIEIIISIAIMSLIAVIMIGGFASYLSLANISAEQTIAINIARREMEEIKSLPFNDVLDLESNTEENTEGNTDYNEYYIIKSKIEQIDEDLLKIEVIVEWEEGEKRLVSLKGDW